MNILQRSISRLLVIIAINFIGNGCAYAQPVQPQVSIQLLGPEQGLPDRSVKALVQDKAGFLWIGAGAALWRYDGYSFTNYTHLITEKSGTLTLINDVALSPDGNLWVAHSNGLSIVNPANLQTKSIDVASLYPGKITSRQTTKIFFDHEHFAWVSLVGNNVVKLDSSAKAILHFKAKSKEGDIYSDKRSVFHFLENKNELYLFSLYDYVDVINKQGIFQRRIELQDKDAPKGFFPSYLNYSDNNGIWVYYRPTNLKGILIREYSFDTKTFNPKLNPTDNVYPGAIFDDNRDYKWFKSENEIGFLEPRTKKFYSLTKQIQDKVGSGTYFFSALISSDNTFWLCSGAGLFKITVTEQLFNTYLSIPLQKPTDIGTSMRGITEDDKGNLWLCTYGYKKNDSTFLLHELNPSTGIVEGKNIQVLYDTSKTAYTSTFLFYKVAFSKSGAYAVTDGTQVLKLEPTPLSVKVKPYYGVSVNGFTTIYVLNDSILWLGSISGMITMNMHTGVSTLLTTQPGNYLKNVRVNYFMPWNAGTWLACTNNGLYVLNRNAEIVEHYGNNKTDKIKLPVQHFLYTVWHEKNLWAATSEGLLRIDTATKQTELFTTQDGLPDNNVYACLPDEQGNLWLSTNNGICRFNIASKKSHNYGLADGLPHMEFNTASYLKSRSGKLYFGGLNGVIEFDPARLNSSKEEESTLQLISYSKYSAQTNKVEMVPGNNIEGTIFFSPGDRFFSFSFMAPDFRHTEQNRFRYKLHGWGDNEWHLFETGNRLLFNSLPPGSYKLEVQVSVGGADWGHKSWSAIIKVKAPWYESPWFYGFILLAVASIFYALYRYRLSQVIRIYKIRNRISADMHDEIGSTLSSISFYSQALLMQANDNKQKEVLEKIKDNAQQVQEGLSDIIWSVKASMDEIENVFARMFRFGSELLESKGIQFHFERGEKLEHEKLDMTKRKNFYLIFKEAINNAAKYANCKNIWVQINEEHNKIQMTIRDDGQGFDPTHAERGNGLSNMHERAAQMDGKLTVQSNGEGTTIKLIF